MMSTWNKGRGFNAFISRTNPGRFANSAPEMPSSTKTEASSIVQPFRAAYCRAWATCRVTLFASSAIAWSVDLRA